VLLLPAPAERLLLPLSTEVAVDEDTRKLYEEGFIKEYPDKVVIDIDLKKLCDAFGPQRAHQMSKVLNKFLTYLDKELGYTITQYVGMMRVETVATRGQTAAMSRIGW